MWVGIVLMPIWIQSEILFDAMRIQIRIWILPKDMAKLIIDKSERTKYSRIFSIEEHRIGVWSYKNHLWFF